MQLGEAAVEAPGGPDRAGGSRAAWWAVGVLLLFYVFSSVDRSIINMMVQPLERDLHVTDFQISLLQGPAFGLFYAVCGLPMGWLADRVSRRWLAAAGVTVWGLATCFCGMAGSVAQLFVGRIGVGVGESVLMPTAHSMIAEQFPKKRLATAISVYTLGSVVGFALALALGGTVVRLVTHMPPVQLPLVGAVRAWQLAFLVVGVPTVLVMPLVFTLRERTGGSGAASRPAGEGSGFGEFFRSHWRLMLGLPLAFGLTNVLIQAYSAWVPTYMIRGFGWNAAQVGLATGLILLVGGLGGQMLSAVVVDWLYGRGVRDAHTRYHLWSLLASVPCVLLAFQCASPVAFLALMAVYYFLTYPFMGYAAAALQIVAPSRARGQAAAMFLAIVTVVGTLLGPTSVAWLSDNVFEGPGRLGAALTAVTAVCGPLVILTLVWVGGVIRGLQPAAPAPAAAQPLEAPT